MKDNLFDASALLNIMLSKDLKMLGLLKTGSILDLTIYEVGNAIWRLAYVQKRITAQQACDLIEYFVLIKQGMLIRHVTDIEYVKKISMETGLTFYDSSYIAIAKRDKLTLVTDDKQLSKTASKYNYSVIKSDDCKI